LFVSAMAISDPFFSGNQSSWMSFPPVSIRHRTDLKLQFQTLSPEGIVFYTAQHLSARAGRNKRNHSILYTALFSCHLWFIETC
jgi:hypothetical protein